MGERSKSSLGIITRKSLVSLLTIASILFFLPWFFVLRSTSIDSSLFTNTNNNPLHVVNNGNSEAGIRNLAILNDSVEEEEEEAELTQKKCNTKNKAILKVYMYDLPPEFRLESTRRKCLPDVTKNIPQYPTMDRHCGIRKSLFSSCKPIRSSISENEVPKSLLHVYSFGRNSNLEVKFTLTRTPFTAALATYGQLGLLQLGKSIHSKIVEYGLEYGGVVANCLIDMYCKCSLLEDAISVFNKMVDKDIISWNSVIATRNHDLEQAFRFFH
ncbi:hypothetical protein LWI28_001644 [Acer negundo]|uniref:Pentatricopeptide repeat-containing protein n=1 Tax=Acer negundo TaxID=4023 RepID=A0AAD5IBH4_ACENE|nr:hypothetical protein LWI28_001644 [Acer negundo]